MHHYQHHIGDFNNATRYLTRVERSLYRDLIELYYDTESPLTTDINRLQRRVMAESDEEKEALAFVLEEFFYLDDDAYRHYRCDAEIAAYREYQSGKSKAGKASAAARAAKAAEKSEKEKQQKATAVEQPLNTCATEREVTVNRKPLTNNQLKPKPLARSSPAEPPSGPVAEASPAVIVLPTNKFNTTGETVTVTEAMLPDWQAAYPAVDIRQELLRAKAWLQDNPTKRKTTRGMRRFLGGWFERQQNRGSQHSRSPPASRPKETAAERMRRELQESQRIIP